jgi:hypothetical protein
LLPGIGNSGNQEKRRKYMARRKNHKLDLWAPQFGFWNETEHGPPPAGASFVATWISKAGTIRVGLACCYYYDDDGKKVDPDE